MDGIFIGLFISERRILWNDPVFRFFRKKKTDMRNMTNRLHLTLVSRRKTKYNMERKHLKGPQDTGENRHGIAQETAVCLY